MPKPRKPVTDKNALLDAACERADDILRLYRQFAEKKPVMLLELPSQRIYAYPYDQLPDARVQAAWNAGLLCCVGETYRRASSSSTVRKDVGS
jgi:hypothetical protein